MAHTPDPLHFCVTCGQPVDPPFGEWQPIETAPKDGTWFVICRAGEPDSCEAGCFSQLMWDKYVDVGGDLYRKVAEPVFDWRGFDNFHRATHWMPLPAPPAEPPP